MTIFRILFATAVLSLSACGGQTAVRDLAPVTDLNGTTSVSRDVNQGAQFITPQVRARLLAHHATWRGTPHEWGGLTRDGVDCSGYIFHTYRDVFLRELPRTTLAQAQLGESIDRSQLRDGDLVFFRIGRNQRHAGVYIGNGQFAHASYSKGVIISSLDNVYWKRHYWQSRRLL